MPHGRRTWCWMIDLSLGKNQTLEDYKHNRVITFLNKLQ